MLEVAMPARSKAQQKAAGAALAVKRGEADRSSLKGAAKEMFESMTEEELEDFAATSHEGLPACPERSGFSRVSDVRIPMALVRTARRLPSRT